MWDSQFVSSEQCKAARVRLGLSQAKLAKAAGLSERTLIKFENGENTERKTGLAIKAALMSEGIRPVENEEVEGVIWMRPIQTAKAA